MRAASVVAVVAVLAAPVRAEVLLSLRGRVVSVDGAPIGGASISAGGATAIAGADGAFVLDGVPPGSVGLLVVADGYLPTVVTVADSERPGAVIALSPEPDTGEIIELSGEAPDTGETTRYALSPEQIRALPGAGNDVLRALQSLPGVARTPYGLGGLVLRGADPEDTRVYLDGIEVPMAFHFGGVTSFYPSTLLADVEIAPGGGDVSRGRSVGGLVEMTSRAPRTDRLRMGAEASVLDAALYAEGPTVHGGGVAIGLRRSYVDAILGEVLPPENRYLPRYYDAQLRWDQPVGGGVLSAIAFYSDDHLRRGDDIDVGQWFARAGLRYRRTWDATSVEALAWIGLRRLTIDDRRAAADDSHQPFFMHLALMPLGGRVDVRRDEAWGHIAVGLDAKVDTKQELALEGTGALGGFRQDTPDADPLDTNAAKLPPASAELAAWLEARWRIADGKLTLRPGARIEHLTASDEWLLEPRVVVSHQLTRWLTLRESLGVHHQPAAVGQTTSRRDAERRTFARPAAARGVHASIGADVDLPADVHASVTAYHAEVAGPAIPTKRMDDGPVAGEDGLESLLGLVVANLAGNELGNDDGRLRSRGIELMLSRETERARLRVSYTLARAHHHTGPRDGARWIPTALDQTHNLGAVASARLGAWQVGARVRYATGAPYTPYTRNPDGTWSYDFGPPRSRRLPAFVSLDLRVDRAWPRSWGTVATYLEIWNATRADNIEGHILDDDGPRPLRGWPILPLVGLSYAPPP